MVYYMIAILLTVDQKIYNQCHLLEGMNDALYIVQQVLSVQNWSELWACVHKHGCHERALLNANARCKVPHIQGQPAKQATKLERSERRGGLSHL